MSGHGEPLRKVRKSEWTGASRYTGYQHKTIKLTLECGHTNYRKASQGIPLRARCRDCAHDGKPSLQEGSAERAEGERANPPKQTGER